MMRFIRLLTSASLLVSKKMDEAAAARARYEIFEEGAGDPGSPRIIVMYDHQAGLEAAVAPSEGGELTSLRARFHHLPIELLYRARDYGCAPGFRGKAPLLWPGAGAQCCDGFAKDLPWTEAGHSTGPKGARVVVELRDSELTRVTYPFGFVVRAVYELAEGRLRIAYTVSAAGGNPAPMPFSMANRMAFRLPFLDGTDPDAMRFQTPNTRQMLRTPAGALSGEQVDRSFATPTRLGDFDATQTLPLAGYEGTPFARLTDPQGLSLRISHHASAPLPEPFVQFNVSGGPREGFLCLAPWFGMENSLNSRHALVMLSPGCDFHWTLELRAEVAVDPAAMP